MTMMELCVAKEMWDGLSLEIQDASLLGRGGELKR